MEKEFKSKFGNKVSFTGAFQNSASIWYNVECSCGGHSTKIEIEYDKELNMIVLHFYEDIDYCEYYETYIKDSIIEKIKEIYTVTKNRIKDGLKLIFTRYIKLSTDIVIMEESHINDFIEALQEGLQYIKEEKEKDLIKEKSNENKMDVISNENK